MDHESAKSELPDTVLLKELDNGPLSVEIKANEAQCSTIAERLSLEKLSALKGSITLEKAPQKSNLFTDDYIEGHGELTATVTQQCVVSLEPFETSIVSEFSGVFSNEDPMDGIHDADDEVQVEAPDILGPIGDDHIQIGEVFIEQLALEIDPFPRKPGTEFGGFSSDSSNSGDSPSESPFAVLAKLKDNLE